MTNLVTLSDGSVLDVAAYPLPEGVEDGAVSRKDLARIFNVSENTITKWLGQGLPVESEGANGVAYEFRLSHCHAWRQARDAEARAARSRVDAMVQQASLAFRNLDDDQEEEEAGLSAKEIQAWAVAEYNRNRAAEQRGELVRAARVQEMLEDLMGILRTSMSTLPDHLERELGLTSVDVERVQTHCDGVLVKIKARIRAEMLGPGEVALFGATPAQAGLN